MSGSSTTALAAEVVEAYRRGTAIKALARQHHVAPKTIRRILDNARARGLPDRLDTLPAAGEPADAPTPPGPAVTLDLPGLLADHLNAAGDDAVRQALGAGRTIRRGQGHTVRVTAPIALHRAALRQSGALAAEGAGPAARKASIMQCAAVRILRLPTTDAVHDWPWGPPPTRTP
ncbi:helix-turn-helix domain-containing protein [Actinomadura fulvescens]